MEIARSRLADVGRDLGDGGGVEAGVLADVERLEMKAVGADLDQQRIDQHLRQAVAVVFGEAGAQQGEVVEQIGGAGVGGKRRFGGERQAGLRGRSQPHHDAGDEQAEALVAEALFDRGLAGGAKLVEVAVEQRRDLGGDGNLLDRAAKLLEDVLQAAAVVVEQQVLRHGRASRVTSETTKGLPSRSPPIQEPKLTSWGRLEMAVGLGVSRLRSGYSAARAAATSE